MSSGFDLRVFEGTWEAAGQRVAPLVDGVSAVGIIGDDLVAVAAATMGLARAQAARRLVYVGDMLGDESSLARTFDDASLGISDMIRYGVSLSRVAHNLPESSNLFALPAGAESPLAPDVLESDRWRSLSESIHRGRGLLLVALPSKLPEVERLLAQLDGVLVVGDMTSAPPGVTILGDVRTAATMRTPALASVAQLHPEKERRPQRLLLVAGASIAILGAAALGWILLRPDTETPSVAATTPSVLPPPPTATRIESGAAWLAEIAYTNSAPNALGRVQALADSLPAPTYAQVPLPVDSVPWFRVLAGAFPDSISAENFLRSLRERRVLSGTSGTVVYAPFAFLLDSAGSEALALVRVRAYQGRGLPAYALHDTLGTWRIYAGAFASHADAARAKPQLDTLNIQSTLTVRVGSTP